MTGITWILVYVVINVFVGTVTSSSPVVSMVDDLENASVDELLEQDFLLPVAVPHNTTRRRPKLNTPKLAPATERNVRPMKRKLKEFILEDDLLIPIGREGLSREKRQVVVDPDEGSGTPANIVTATVTLDLPYDPLADYSALQAAAEVALFQKYIQADLAFLGLTSIILNNGGKVQVGHNIQFLDRDDRVLVAYALKKYVLNEGMLAATGPASAAVTTDPTIFNAALTERPAICFLCPASRPCALGGDGLYSCGPFSTAVSSELFPWGFSMCDHKLLKLQPTSFDVVSNLLPIEAGFPLGAVAQTNMAVGDNGGVSFGTPYNPNTLTDIMNAISPILCVYCADGDLRNTGSSANVFYQTYPLGKPESIPILERATAEVRTHTANTDYVASWAAVVTWHGLPDFDSTAQTMPNPERNTFQAVLSTDGVESYWQIFYKDMQWVTAERQLSVLGFQPATGVNPLNAFSRTVGSLASQPTQMDMVLGNTGQLGVWLFNTGTVVETDPSARQCREWYIRNYPLKSTFVQQAAALPSCPCTLDHMLTMGIYFQITKTATLYCAELINNGLNEDSKSCCYNIASRGLESAPPLAGNYYRYGSLSNFNAHVTEDLVPLKQCCIDNPSLCPLFQELRPSPSTCLPQPGQMRIGCFGDPHFTTFDGRDFSFNGLGEYTLFTLDYKPQQFKFVLQCRTEVAVRADASTSKATVFTAFAGKQFGFAPTDGGSFHIEMNSNKTKMVVYINGIDRSTLFYAEANYVEWTSTLYATKISISTIRFTFPVSEVSIDITLSAKSLSFSVALDNRFQGMTSGLLGNFDGDDTNDFNTSSGDSLPATATERQLFDMGKTWAVTPPSSILRYSPGMSCPDYFNNTFVPLFMDEIDPVTRTAAEAICGTEPSDQCVFDYVVTGDNMLAISTKTIKTESDQTQAVLSNSAPTVNGTDSLRVQVGHSVSLEFDGSDAEGDSFKYVLLDQPRSGFMFDPDTGRGSWTPRDSTPVKISLNAEDSHGMKSRLINVKVTLCEGCEHGRCDYLHPQTGVPGSTQHFHLATCVCDVGWTGSTCSEDYDGCMSGPCGEGRTCTDEDPTVHATTGRGYTCSSCPIGYYSDPGDVKCQDVNECLAGDDCPDNSVCDNTKGSFICTCLSGYRKNSKGDCVDIEECSEHRHNCSQTCVNTLGGYQCDCLTGFVLNTDGSSCTQVQVPSSCFTFGCAHLCALNEDNLPQCYCQAGFKLGPDGKTCSDMNECGMSLCSQTCDNTDGSYTCSCYSGFFLDDDGYSCTECPFPFWGPSCNNTCECQGHATGCDPVHGCMCVPGWTGVNCAVNINECDLDPTICSSQQTCVDTLGSYQCRCPEGFKKQGLECVDIDECEARVNPCPDKFQCRNTPGSFTCHCQEGYTQVDQQCVDIDECTNGQARCEQLCVNVPGTYNCLCHYGYDLGDDRKTCEKTAAASCAATEVISCSHYCVMENNHPRCGCKRGYALAADRKTCLDINECSSNTSNQCSHDCDNIPGTYRCSCPRGMSLQNDERTCAACDSQHWGRDCSRMCNCHPKGSQRCDKTLGCVCHGGWTGDKCDQDKDECSTVTCQTNSDCQNLPGSYRCQCRSGYSLSADNTTCEEINECSHTKDNMCDHNCHNTEGSYYCSCNAGFVLEGKGTCRDIDECYLAISGCTQECTNTHGGYICDCFDGFTLDGSDGKSCLQMSKCANTTRCSQGCRVSRGVEVCFCSHGYQINTDGVTCDDIKECELSPPRCSQGCVESVGSYTCTCEDGFYLAADKTTCLACSYGRYGPNCTNTCSCDSTNTISCNTTDGSCTCRSGWRGATCTEDIPECTDNPSICGINSVCNERNGSYACTCLPGHVRTNNSCSACDARHYGEGCVHECSCVLDNTESCDAVTGSCTCRPQWTGGSCETDVNECTDSAPICPAANQKCRNKPGSYECGCIKGYVKAANDVCIDENECLQRHLHSCEYECVNLPGTYDCVCPRGYSGSGNNCQAAFISFNATITLNIDRGIIINGSSSSLLYVSLQDSIATAVDSVVESVAREAFVPSKTGSLRSGSVIADVELRVDTRNTDIPWSILAAILQKLAATPTLPVSGQIVPLQTVAYNGTNIPNSADACDVLKIVQHLSVDTVCVIGPGGVPQIRDQTDEDVSGMRMFVILGSVVTAVVVLVVSLTFILYCCCCRRRGKTEVPIDDNHAFRTAFTGNLPTKGNFGASRYMMYSPHTLSETASQSSIESTIRHKAWRNVPTRKNVADSSREGNVGPSPYTGGRGNATSNFSWENMFHRLDTSRNGQFAVPRPTYQRPSEIRLKHGRHETNSAA